MGHPLPPSPSSRGSSAFSYPMSRDRVTKHGFRAQYRSSAWWWSGSVRPIAPTRRPSRLTPPYENLPRAGPTGRVRAAALPTCAIAARTQGSPYGTLGRLTRVGRLRRDAITGDLGHIATRGNDDWGI